MRLLNVHTLEFREFHGSDRPPYAIASHRWIGEEITFQQFRDREINPQIKDIPGFVKILSFCEFMRDWGKSISCPSRKSEEPNSKGECGSCFSRKFKCDKKRPKCDNCSHDGLPCGYNVLKATFTSDPSAQQSQAATDQSHTMPGHISGANKSCKACAVANKICSAQRPICSRCQTEGLECDYESSLSTKTGLKSHQDVTDIEWIWIDTCCIDKSSSAELVEAINSMFGWYSDSYACVAYMQDIRPQHHAPTTILIDFMRSSWFTRGWTLQELLAPNLVVFLDQNWKVFGHKSGPAGSPIMISASKIRLPLNPWISAISGIKQSILLDHSKIKEVSIEERLTWMNGRTTTRVEDRAYCLLGICDVFMPLIYGEGERACDRLEEVINNAYGGSRAKVYGLRKRLLDPTGQTRDKVTVSEVLDSFSSERAERPNFRQDETQAGRPPHPIPQESTNQHHVAPTYDYPYGVPPPPMPPPPMPPPPMPPPPMPPPSPHPFMPNPEIDIVPPGPGAKRPPVRVHRAKYVRRHNSPRRRSPRRHSQRTWAGSGSSRRERDGREYDRMMGQTSRVVEEDDHYEVYDQPTPSWRDRRTQQQESPSVVSVESYESATSEPEDDASPESSDSYEPVHRRRGTSRHHRRRQDLPSFDSAIVEERQLNAAYANGHRLNQLEEMVAQLTAELKVQQYTKTSQEQDGSHMKHRDSKVAREPRKPRSRASKAMPSGSRPPTPPQSTKTGITTPKPDSADRKYRFVVEEVQEGIDGLLAPDPSQRFVIGDTASIASMPIPPPLPPTTAQSRMSEPRADRLSWRRPVAGNEAGAPSYADWLRSSNSFSGYPQGFEAVPPNVQQRSCLIM